MLPLAVVLLALAAGRRRRALAAFAGRGAALVGRSAARQRVKALLLLAAAAFAILALAGPYVDQRARTVRHIGIDLVIAVDISQSMAVRDVAIGREPADRLRAARETVDALARRMEGSRIALVLFANEGVVRYPSTTDPAVLAGALDNSARGFRLPAGSSLKAGLAAAATAFPEAKAGAPRRALVVLSDGEYPASDAPDLTPFKDQGVRIFSLGIGTTAGERIPTYDREGKFTGYLRGADGQPVVSRLSEERLRTIAEETGGRYWQYGGLGDPFGELVRELRAMDTATVEAESGTVPDDRYQILVAIALVLLLVEWLVDERVRMPAPRGARPAPRPRRRLLGPIGAALTVLLLGACSDAVFEQNRVANTLYARGDARAALARYRDMQRAYPELLPMLAVNAGNALHRMGEHARAVSEYALALDGGDDRTRLNAHYGRGSSLFRQGKLEEARAAFIEALKIDPSDRDSKFNLEVIDRLRAPAQVRPGDGQGEQGGQGQQGGQQGQQGQQPGNQTQPGDQAGQAGQSGQGDPISSSGSNTPAAPSLDRALLEFRRNLTEEEALRVLDALRNELRGIEGLLEGAPRPGDGRDPY